MSSGVPYIALLRLTVARSGPPWTVPSGLVASFNWRTRLARRRCRASSFSAAVSHTKNARVTPTDSGRRRILPEQQVVAALGDPAHRALAAGAHPDRRVRALRRRRLDDDLVELPPAALVRKRLVRCPG